LKKSVLASIGKTPSTAVPGRCLCGDVHIEIDFPARWAWHDHSDAAAGTTRSFCARCGTPICYERARSPHMVNVPRALFKSRTGRQVRYHIGIEQMPEWTYLGERLVPLKGFPGVVWDRSKRKPRAPPTAAT
jgi:hypothetical protein